MAEQILVDLSRQLLQLTGEPIEEIVGTKEEDGKKVPKKVVLTVRTILSNAIQTPLRGDENFALSMREKHFDILIRIHQHPVMQFTDDEVTILKERLGKLNYSTLIIGQVARILDGKPVGIVEPKEDDPIDTSTDDQPSLDEPEEDYNVEEPEKGKASE